MGVQIRSIHLVVPGGNPSLDLPVLEMTLAAMALLGGFLLAGLSLPLSSLASAAFVGGSATSWDATGSASRHILWRFSSWRREL